MKPFWVAAAALALAFSAPAAADTPARSFEALYSVSAKGLTAGEFSYRLRVANGAYEANAERRMTGFVRSLVGESQDYRYSVRGRATAQGLQPTAYEHQGGKKNRKVEVSFANGAPTTTATPSMGMGDPPATAAQKAGSLDQLTAIASMVTASGDPCQRTIRVLLDGRSRFDFVMRGAGVQNVNSRAYRGEAVRCSVEYRPIAGFSDPQEPATLTFLFAKTPSGLYAPIRIEMPTDDVGVAVLQARSFTAS